MYKTTSGYVGVSWHKKSKKWRAQIARDGNTYHVGLYESPKIAAIAYAQAKKKYPPKYYGRKAKIKMSS